MSLGVGERGYSQEEVFDNWVIDMKIDILDAIESSVGIEFAEAMDGELDVVFSRKSVIHLFDMYLEYNYEKIEIEENTYFISKCDRSEV